MDNLLPESIIANYFENGILPRCDSNEKNILNLCYEKGDGSRYHLSKEVSGEQKVNLLNILGRLGYIDYQAFSSETDNNEENEEEDDINDENEETSSFREDKNTEYEDYNSQTSSEEEEEEVIIDQSAVRQTNETETHYNQYESSYNQKEYVNSKNNEIINEDKAIEIEHEVEVVVESLTAYVEKNETLIDEDIRENHNEEQKVETKEIINDEPAITTNNQVRSSENKTSTQSDSNPVSRSSGGGFAVFCKFISFVALIAGSIGVYYTWGLTNRIDFVIYAAVLVIALFAVLFGFADIITLLSILVKGDSGSLIFSPTKGSYGKRTQNSTSTSMGFDRSITLYPTKINDKYGYIDNTGSIIIEPKFDNCYYFYDDLAVVRVENQDGFINRAGDIVIEPVYDLANNFYEGVSKVKYKGKFYYINKNGDRIIAFDDYNFVGDFYDGMCSFKKDGKWGYFDNSGKIVIKPNFDDAYDFVGDFAKVRIGDDFAYIDRKGKIIKKF